MSIESLDYVKISRSLKRLEIDLSPEDLKTETEAFLHEPFDPKLVVTIQKTQRIFQMRSQIQHFGEEIFDDLQKKPLFRPITARLDKERFIFNLQKEIMPRYKPMLLKQLEAASQVWSYSTKEERLFCLKQGIPFVDKYCDSHKTDFLNGFVQHLEPLIGQIISRIPPALALKLTSEMQTTDQELSSILQKGASAVVNPILNEIRRFYKTR
ncbi:MAG: hypothetical protein WC371_02500 [Parachlamydiales bacterium]|jgi:hypothetical protein